MGHATHKQVFGLASMVDLGTRHDTNDHASLRPASAQVSSRFPAVFGPASIMEFGLNSTSGRKYLSENGFRDIDFLYGVNILAA